MWHLFSSGDEYAKNSRNKKINKNLIYQFFFWTIKLSEFKFGYKYKDPRFNKKKRLTTQK